MKRVGSPLRYPQVCQFEKSGLERFLIDFETITPQKAIFQPRLMVCPDQGSDNVCMRNFCDHIGLNIDWAWDHSHGANNDIWLALGASDLKNTAYAFLVGCNIKFTPYEEDTRFMQTASTWNELFQNCTADDLPLFKSLFTEFLADEANSDLRTAKDQEAALFERMKTCPYWSRRGTKIVKARFMALTRTVRSDFANLTSIKFGYKHVATELGLWTAGAMAKVVVKDAAADEKTTTARKKETPVDKAYRETTSVGAKLLFGAILYGDAGAAMRMRIILEVSDAIEKWQAK